MGGQPAVRCRRPVAPAGRPAVRSGRRSTVRSTGGGGVPGRVDRHEPNTDHSGRGRACRPPVAARPLIPGPAAPLRPGVHRRHGDLLARTAGARRSRPRDRTVRFGRDRHRRTGPDARPHPASRRRRATAPAHRRKSSRSTGTAGRTARRALGGGEPGAAGATACHGPDPGEPGRLRRRRAGTRGGVRDPGERRRRHRRDRSGRGHRPRRHRRPVRRAGRGHRQRPADVTDRRRAAPGEPDDPGRRAGVARRGAAGGTARQGEPSGVRSRAAASAPGRHDRSAGRRPGRRTGHGRDRMFRAWRMGRGGEAAVGGESADHRVAAPRRPPGCSRRSGSP